MTSVEESAMGSEEFPHRLRGLACRGVERPDDHSWRFTFDADASTTFHCPWQVLGSDGGIARGRDDDRQLFGLDQPVDAEADAISLLGGSPVAIVVIASGTADLRITFANGAALDSFNDSAGYEGWTASMVVEAGPSSSSLAVVSSTSSGSSTRAALSRPPRDPIVTP